VRFRGHSWSFAWRSHTGLGRRPSPSERESD